jgi:hypothetical protein
MADLRTRQGQRYSTGYPDQLASSADIESTLEQKQNKNEKFPLFT